MHGIGPPVLKKKAEVEGAGKGEGMLKKTC